MQSTLTFAFFVEFFLIYYLSFEILDCLKVQIIHHCDGLAALCLFLLLKKSNLVASVVPELKNVGEHAAWKDLNPKHVKLWSRINFELKHASICRSTMEQFP